MINKIKILYLKLINRFVKSTDHISTSITGNEPPIFIEKVSDVQELFIHTKDVWEYLGNFEPYWSVITVENFKMSNMGRKKLEFYNSGFYNVKTLFNTLDRNEIDHTSLKSCLEYGCGLGRVTYWLSQRFETVWGYDISSSHLKLASQNFNEFNIRNVSFNQIMKPQDIGNFPKVDLVYSVIVLQHNPPPIISLIIQEMLRALNCGGIAFFQVPTYQEGYRFVLMEYLNSGLLNNQMEMHVFPQKDIFDIVRKEKCKILEILEDDWAGLRNGYRSNTFVLQKE
jgi:SAM-dependent methyltransferase